MDCDWIKKKNQNTNVLGSHQKNDNIHVAQKVRLEQAENTEISLNQTYHRWAGCYTIIYLKKHFPL